MSYLVIMDASEEMSGSEGEYQLRESIHTEPEKRDDRGAGGASTGFDFSGIDTLSALKLHRSGHCSEKSLRYLHSLWTPGALMQTDPTGGKMTSSRARRRRRNVGPIGKDLYGMGSIMTILLVSFF